MYQKYDKLLHGSKKKNQTEILSIPFLKKYILYAKTRVKPKLTDPAIEFIVDKYVFLRSESGNSKSLPVTARTLETLIRLATAHAKARLSNDISKEDAEDAYEIVANGSAHEQTNGAQNDENDDAENNDPNTSGNGGSRKRGRDLTDNDLQDSTRLKKALRSSYQQGSSTRGSGAASDANATNTDSGSSQAGTSQATNSADMDVDMDVSPERFLQCVALISDMKENNVEFGKVLSSVNKKLFEKDKTATKFTEMEVTQVLKKMDVDGTLMFDNGRVYFF